MTKVLVVGDGFGCCPFGVALGWSSDNPNVLALGVSELRCIAFNGLGTHVVQCLTNP